MFQHQCLLLLLITIAPSIILCGPHFLRERYICKLGLACPVSPVCLLQPPGTETHKMDYMSESEASVSEDISFKESEESDENETYSTDRPVTSEGLECCFPEEDYDHVLDSLSHEDFYVVDFALVNNCFMSWITGWIPWLNEHYRLGKRLYVLDFVAQEVVDIHAKSMPKYFQIIRYQPEVTNAVMNNVLKQLKEAYSIDRDNWQWKVGVLQVDLLSLAIAGYAVEHADRMQFPESDRRPSKVIYMTSPTTNYCLKIASQGDHKIFEGIVSSNGLGNLLQFRQLLFGRGKWIDLPFRSKISDNVDAPTCNCGS